MDGVIKHPGLQGVHNKSAAQLSGGIAEQPKAIVSINVFVSVENLKAFVKLLMESYVALNKYRPQVVGFGSSTSICAQSTEFKQTSMICLKAMKD